MLQRCAAALHGTPRGAWQRSSVFARRDRALLVSEIFLEAFAGE
jgi:chorismate-pyruvate lyase